MTTPLWNVTLTTTPAFAPVIEEILSEIALAVSVLSPPRSDTAKVEAIFDHTPDVAALNAQIAVAALVHQAQVPDLQVEKVADINWLKKVASDFPPLSIGRWTVYGAAHKDAVKDKPLALEIEATNAFGTGEHETTRGCLLSLDEFLQKIGTPEDLRMLDVGCGSGILAMAFAQATKGFGRAVAVDLDPDAVHITEENVKKNGLEAQVSIGVSDGYNAALVRDNAPYDLIMSNIFAGPLCDFAPALKKNLKPGGTAILAGLLTTQSDAVVKAHEQQGLVVQKTLILGEWTILALTTASRA